VTLWFERSIAIFVVVLFPSLRLAQATCLILAIGQVSTARFDGSQ
jgi:hypothetical protein